MRNFSKYIFLRIGKIITILLNNKTSLKICNIIYENAPYIFIRFFIKFVNFPNRDFTWKIKLLNKKKVKTEIDKTEIKTVQFAVSYKWHSQPINNIEHLLNSYYPKDVPWIDVGANLGLRSLIALSDLRPVYFIEPNAKLNAINKNRCELNHFSNYTILPYGASNFKGKVEFFIDKTSYNSTIEVKSLKESVNVTDKIIISVDTLDNLFKYQLEKIKDAYIKIDVEGHELKTLEGAKKLIATVKPTILIEVNEKRKHFDDFLAAISTYDYRIFELGNFKKNKYLKPIKIANYNSETLKYNDFLLVDNSKTRFLKILEKYTI